MFTDLNACVCNINVYIRISARVPSMLKKHFRGYPKRQRRKCIEMDKWKLQTDVVIECDSWLYCMCHVHVYLMNLKFWNLVRLKGLTIIRKMIAMENIIIVSKHRSARFLQCSLYRAWCLITRAAMLFICDPNNHFNTVKPVYNDHLMGYFSAFWRTPRWSRAT